MMLHTWRMVDIVKFPIKLTKIYTSENANRYLQLLRNTFFTGICNAKYYIIQYIINIYYVLSSI